MYDDISFRRSNEAALRDCEERWLRDDRDDHVNDYNDDDYPYDTAEEAYE